MLQLFIQYIEHELRYSKATVKAYQSDIAQFEQFLKNESTVIEDVDKRQFRYYLNMLKREQISARSIARKISALKHYFRFLAEHGYVTQNRIEEITLPTQQKRLPKVLYNEELADLFEREREEGFAGVRLQLILELLYGCGIRVSELVTMSNQDILYTEGVILIRGKGNKERYVPFGSYVQKALEAYRATPEYQMKTTTKLLINQKGEALTTRGIHYLLTKEAERLHMHIPIHPHLFRHTFATDMLNEGANLREVQEMLGHAHLSSTQVYTHVSTAKLQNAYLQAHPRAHKKTNVKE